jgi:hypothetical protein
MLDFVTAYEIVGLCVTLASTVLVYLKSAADARKQNAALVSLIGVIFTMLTSLRFEALPKIERHLEIEETLSKNRQLLPLIEQIASAQQLEGSAHPLMRYMLQQRLESLESQFEKMSRGRFLVDESEMPNFALEMIKSAKEKILATSYVQASRWWETPWGKHYEELNETKAKDGVRITRIFIFQEKSDMARIEEVMKAEKHAGIDVRYAYLQDLTDNITSDLVVIDSNLSGELRLTPDKVMTFAEFMTNQSDVADTSHRIEKVEIESAQYETSSPRTSK